MLWHCYCRKIGELVGTFIRTKTGGVIIATACGSVLSGVFYLNVNGYEHVKMKNEKADTKHLSLEEKFRAFASLQLNGVLLMTPSDFLRSLVGDQKQVKMMITNEPQFIEKIMTKASKKKYGSRFFRNLQNDGIITFSEYLFLLHILTKTPSGFEIAFKMLDRDLSGSVDAREFMILNHIIAESTDDMPDTDRGACDLLLPADQAYNTTLMAHLFGYNKTNNLSFEEFKRFMCNVQTEALEVEFQEFSSGSSAITPVDFARIILRYTTVSASEYDAFINRLEKAVPPNIAITFNEFLKFFMFLNCLDDFALAVKMYTIAGQPISLPEFKRAVKACIGNELSSDVLTVLFALFDRDGDNCLSYNEFIHIMRERHSGGLSHTSKHNQHTRIFRKCLKRELQSSVN
uniref:Putative ef hand domain family, member A2 n=1 Tax=Schistosoma mansoni TaxID=6183 RepID=A0A5K4EB89_SCHMA